MSKTRVLFVCMGNICRSPTAEGVFRDKAKKAGWEKQIEIDSAGTHGFHVGSTPDARAQKTALSRGYDLSSLRGRQVSDQDFASFDYVLAMDRDNLHNLQQRCPEQYKHKVRLYLAFSSRFPNLNVPDPYYGGGKGFEQVLDMVEDAAEGLLREIARNSA
ncbi:MAG: low molecular weight protein-tyrosine-phosphatase [Pseudomonadota bacterium]|nr:low molecular weight protein-tyrosine-phosphatase [Pseudomonadota bacterium]